MLSVLYFAVYTIIMILSCIYPGEIGWYFAAAFILTVGAYTLKVMMPLRFVKKIKEDDIHFYNISDVTDLPYGLEFILITAYIAMLIVPIFIPVRLSLWLFYILTMLATYVCPLVLHLIWRTKLYRQLKQKGCRIPANLRELFFSGRRNIHYTEVKSAERNYKIGIIGGVGQMRYMIDGNKLSSQRVNSVLREYILEFERADSEIVQLWTKLFSGKPKTQELRADENCDYLMLQPNAFIVSNDHLVNIGETVEGMRVIDMTNGVKYLR